MRCVSGNAEVCVNSGGESHDVVAMNRDGYAEVVLHGSAGGQGRIAVSNGTVLRLVRDLGNGSLEVAFKGQNWNIKKHNSEKEGGQVGTPLPR